MKIGQMASEMYEDFQNVPYSAKSASKFISKLVYLRVAMASMIGLVSSGWRQLRAREKKDLEDFLWDWAVESFLNSFGDFVIINKAARGLVQLSKKYVFDMKNASFIEAPMIDVMATGLQASYDLTMMIKNLITNEVYGKRHSKAYQKKWKTNMQDLIENTADASFKLWGKPFYGLWQTGEGIKNIFTKKKRS